MITHHPAHQQNDPRLAVGTLRYTMAGLVWVFLWLLWGDFCFTVMENVTACIIPLRLKELNAPDWALPLILSTAPSIITFALNPAVSTISDKHRGRWGRRIPFLLFSAPFISGTLVMMAFSPELSIWLHSWLAPLSGWGIGGVSIATLGFLLVCFKMFDVFVNTTFWYLFNDVVPQAFMARFMGLFRVVASLAGMLFNYFFYEHALTHMRWIYLGAATIYLVGFSMMCLFVKEGDYHAVPGSDKTRSLRSRIWKESKRYVTECLSHRIYIYFFLMGMFLKLSDSIAVFSLYLNLSLGITLKQLALINTGIQFSLLVLNYPAGALADRFHPLRVWGVMLLCQMLIQPFSFVWLFRQFSPEQAYHVMIGLTAIDLPIGLLLNAVGIPMMMRLLPRDQFGQFCSFNALACAAMNILGSLAVAGFMTAMRTLLPDEIWGKDFCYRIIPAWRLPFMAIAVFFLWQCVKEWKCLGGEKHYTPPDPLRAEAA